MSISGINTYAGNLVGLTSSLLIRSQSNTTLQMYEQMIGSPSLARSMSQEGQSLLVGQDTQEMLSVQQEMAESAVLGADKVKTTLQRAESLVTEILRSDDPEKRETLMADLREISNTFVDIQSDIEELGDAVSSDAMSQKIHRNIADAVTAGRDALADIESNDELPTEATLTDIRNAIDTVEDASKDLNYLADEIARAALVSMSVEGAYSSLLPALSNDITIPPVNQIDTTGLLQTYYGSAGIAGRAYSNYG